MFYFIINVLMYFIFILVVYYYFSRKRVNILDLIVVLFILNTYTILLYNKENILIGLIITLIIILIRKVFDILYSINHQKISDNQVLINRGNINFHSLIANNYSYEKLIKIIRKKGFKDISKIDYCALYHNELLIFNNQNINYPINLIIDGKIIKDNLLNINKNISWLEENINNHNLLLKDINYAFYKDKKIYFLTN